MARGSAFPALPDPGSQREFSGAGVGIMKLSPEETRLARFAVRDLIARLALARKPCSHALYALNERLDSFVRETKSCPSQPDSPPSTASELIDTTEAAAILNCTPQWVGRIRDKLGVREIGSQRVFPRQSVIEYAERKAGQHR